ncbi:MAG: TRAP transporter small permease [Bacteroidota bacterium]
MKLLLRLDSYLNKVEGSFLITFLGLMVVLAFLQVILRNVFSSGIMWADILLRHLVLWIGFLGAALATSRKRHINIDALTRFLPTKPRHAVGVLTDLFAAGICYLLFRSSITFVQNEIAEKTTIYADIPAWCGEIIIPIGFGLLVVHFVIRGVLSARELFSKGQAA